MKLNSGMNPDFIHLQDDSYSPIAHACTHTHSVCNRTKATILKQNSQLS